MFEFLEKLTDEQLAKEMREMSDKSVFSRKSNVAYGALIRYRWLSSEQRKREIARGEMRRSIFYFEISPG